MVEDDFHPRHVQNEIGRPVFIAHDASFWALHHIFQQLDQYQDIFDEFGVELVHTPSQAENNAQLINNQIDMVIHRETLEEINVIVPDLVDRLEAELQHAELVSSFDPDTAEVTQLENGQFELRIQLYKDFTSRAELEQSTFVEGPGLDADSRPSAVNSESVEGEQQEVEDVVIDLLASTYGRILYTTDREGTFEVFEAALEQIRLIVQHMPFKVIISTSESMAGVSPRRRIVLKMSHRKMEELQEQIYDLMTVLNEDEFPPEVAHWIIYQEPQITQSDKGTFIAHWTVYQDYQSRDELYDRHGVN